MQQISHYISVDQAVVRGSVVVRRKITKCTLIFSSYFGIIQHFPELINENDVKMHLIFQPVAMIHRQGPKSATHFNVKHKFVIKKITIILNEAVEVRFDGQRNRTFS
jgi:hypothetical protein